jgi:hypothetical protein
LRILTQREASSVPGSKVQGSEVKNNENPEQGTLNLIT